VANLGGMFAVKQGQLGTYYQQQLQAQQLYEQQYRYATNASTTNSSAVTMIASDIEWPVLKKKQNESATEWLDRRVNEMCVSL